MLWRIKDTVYLLSTWGFAKGPNISRYFMYRHLSEYRREWPGKAKVLSISGSQKLCKILGFTDEQIVNVEYPEVNMLSLPFPSCEFDAVVSDQVLEHVEGSPEAAIKEAFRVLKPGGVSLHATCFMTEIHGAPGDFWRYTPDALKLLTREYSDIIDCDGWGNPYALIHIILGMRYYPVPHSPWHPLHWLATKNSKNWPISTWVLSRKHIPD